MLRPGVVYLAVGLVFSNLPSNGRTLQVKSLGLEENPYKDQFLMPLRFNEYYTVKIEVHDLLRRTMTPITQWYDQRHLKSRIDVFGTTQQFVFHNPVKDNFNSWLLTTVYPITTEQNGTILNKRVCVNTLYDYYQVNFEVPSALKQLLSIYEEIFGILWMDFPTRERMHNEDAMKWKRTDRVTKAGRRHTDLYKLGEETWWTIYKEIEGVKHIVPLRYENVVHNLKTGKKDEHYRYDFYEYDPSKFDEEIFDITKGLVCSPIGPIQQAKEAKLASKHSDVFANFKANHSREYESEEEHEMRLRIFKENLKMIEEHNRGDHGFKLEVNHLADRTREEVAAMAGHASANTANNGHAFPYTKEEIEKLSAELPKQMDWRIWGAVSPVKEQRNCDASWAFAAAGAVESGLFLHRQRKSRLVQLSEQALIDCSWGSGNAGCHGGDVRNAFDWIKAHGIPNPGEYGPYLGLEGNCQLKDSTNETKIKGYVTVDSDVNALKVALFKHGPVAATIGLTQKLTFYKSGVFSDPECPNDIHSVTHSVLVIGYGILDGQRYWLAKNSWGRSWGVNGYFLIAIEDNMCGVLTDANYPFFE